MKTGLHLSFLFFVMCNICLNAQTRVQMLDQAITASAVRISRDLPADAKAAVINFSSDSAELNNYVVTELHGAILRNRRIVPVTLTQSQIQNINAEMRFIAKGELTDASAQNIGRLLSAQYLITGTIETSSGNHMMIFNVVETANPKNRFQYTAAVDLNNQFLSAQPSQPAVSEVKREPTVTEVKISHTNNSFNNGGRYTFKAAVEGTDKPPQDVTWSVMGQASEKTVISNKGVLTISGDEISQALTIQATSQFDSNVIGEVTVLIEILPPSKNFLSAEVSIWGVGLRYERSIIDVLTLGANFFWQTVNDTVDVGILATARLFPGNSIFFLELGLGYGYMERNYLYYFIDDWMNEGEILYKTSGFMINPAIGFRFFRETRGFFADIFFSVPFVLGERDLLEGNVDAGFRCGIGLGGAW